MQYVTGFIAMFLFASSVCFGNTDQTSFKHFDFNDGLSANLVNTIYQDSTGFVWFGTKNGLNRFDGFSFKHYPFVPNDSNTISGQEVTSIVSVSVGELWVGTETGLNKFNPVTGQNQRYFQRDKDETSILWNYILCLYVSKNKELYVGTSFGICKYIPETDSFDRLPNINEKLRGKSVFIDKIEEDENGNIWFLAGGIHLVQMNPSLEQVVSVNTIPGEKVGEPIRNSFTMINGNIVLGSKDDIVFFLPQQREFRFWNIKGLPKSAELYATAIANNDDQSLYFGTMQSGLLKLNVNTLSVEEQYQVDEFNEKALQGQHIEALYRDRQGRLWLSVLSRGVSMYHSAHDHFKSYNRTYSKPNNLTNSAANFIYCDSKNHVWVATENGLDELKMENGNLRSVAQYKGIDTLYSQAILSIYEDENGVIYTGNYLKGLGIVDKRTKKIKYHPLTENAPVKKESVTSILPMSDGKLWLGTIGNGIVEFDLKTKSSKAIRFNPKEISNYITVLRKDKKGNVWAGAEHGLHKINVSDLSVVSYWASREDNNTVSNNHIQDIYIDEEGLVWICAYKGIDILNQETGEFKHLNQADGLKDEIVYSFQIDNVGNLWIATQSGISQIIVYRKPEFSCKVIDFTEYEGVITAGFIRQSSAHLPSGEIFFGSKSGVNYFRPDQIVNFKNDLNIVLTKFLIYNKEVPMEQFHAKKGKCIEYINELTLKHFENYISFEFAILNSVIPEKARYRYRLLGLANEWTYGDYINRKISFTNLDPKLYQLQIQASIDNEWKDAGFSLPILVKPPFWRTVWALGIYAFLILGFLLLLRKVILTRERQNMLMESEQEEARRLREMDLMKTRFFTNISHEFRTPLTLIISPVEKLIRDNAYPDINNTLKNINVNSKRLLNLINQLLDFRKMEVTGLKLNLNTGDIIRLIKNTTVSFSDLAEKKKIDFRLRSNMESLQTVFDPDKVEKIMFNLLSNAFKYTQEKGRITVEVDCIEQLNLMDWSDNQKKSESTIRIKVIDNGIGISEEQLGSIFERFIQADKGADIVEHGSGIGLSLTHEFVKLHGGEIDVESELDRGTTFTVTLPVNPLSQNEAVDNEQVIGDLVGSAKQRNVASDSMAHPDAPQILLVEDNDDLRFYLHENLKHDYRVIEGVNGKDGMNKALEFIPDLIITDIMMPIMDGFEFCNALRKDQTTSHIPIIVLTAKSSEEEQVKSFNIGVDYYITKPFSFDILEIRIKNIIEQRKKLRMKFNQKLEIEPKEITITSVDEKLFKKALEIVESNISNSEFSVEQFGEELGMSRVQLYKKMISITGKSPVEFIRIMRLKRAAQLLQKSQMRVSEIAYEVGFNNPKYFSKHFKEEFKMLPTEYAARYVNS